MSVVLTEFEPKDDKAAIGSQATSSTTVFSQTISHTPTKPPIVSIGITAEVPFTLADNPLALSPPSAPPKSNNTEGNSPNAQPLTFTFDQMLKSNGANINKDHLLSFEQLKMRADTGSTNTQTLVAFAYFFGRNGVKCNPNEGRRYLKMAADKNEDSAVGAFLKGYAALFEGNRKKPRDFASAKAYFVKSGLGGYLPACYYLGRTLIEESFQYVNSKLQQDEAMLKYVVKELIEPCANQDFIPAKLLLGHCYRHGWGIKKDEKMAFTLYTQVAASGHAIAKFKLGLFYEFGLAELTPDSSKARQWYEAAAAQGWDCHDALERVTPPKCVIL